MYSQCDLQRTHIFRKMNKTIKKRVTAHRLCRSLPSFIGSFQLPIERLDVVGSPDVRHIIRPIDLNVCPHVIHAAPMTHAGFRSW